MDPQPPGFGRIVVKDNNVKTGFIHGNPHVSRRYEETVFYYDGERKSAEISKYGGFSWVKGEFGGKETMSFKFCRFGLIDHFPESKNSIYNNQEKNKKNDKH